MNLLSEISWKHYNWTVAVIALLYYAYVLKRYYAYEIKQMFERLTRSFTHGISKRSQVGNFENTNVNEDKFSAGLNDVGDLISRVQDFFTRIASTSPTKEEMKRYIGLLLAEYQEIKDSPTRQVINQIILSECEKHCTVLLSEEEINVLWNKQ